MENRKSRHVPYTEEELKNEIWKEANGTKYFISNLGRVKYKKNGLISSTHLNYKGYVMVGKNTRVHRLVSFAFIPNPDKKDQVNHKDGNKQNNRLWNLEWVTNKENANHALDSNLRTDNTVVYVDNLETKARTKYMSLRRMSDALKIRPGILISYIKKSPKVPILGKYVVTIEEPDKLAVINTSGRKAKAIYVYDIVTNKWNYYNNITLTSYHTGLSKSAMSTSILKKGYFYNGGYLASESKSTKGMPNKTLDEFKKDRYILNITPYTRVVRDYLLYDYDTKKEYEFHDIARIKRFILKNVPTLKTLSTGIIRTTLFESNAAKEAMLIGGYGIRHKGMGGGWKEYSEAAFVNSRHGKNITMVVVEDIDEGRYIFGIPELAKYLGLVDKNAFIYKCVKENNLDKLVKASKYPNKKLRLLDKSINQS